jgi:hypothetical protein
LRYARAADDGDGVGVRDIFECHFEHGRAGESGLRIADLPHQRLSRCRVCECRYQCE